ncbi:MAG: glutamate 5-kinase [Rhodoluna sp.]
MSDHGRRLLEAKRVVVKIGSNSVTGKNEGKIDQLVDALAMAMERGAEVVLVSSGAIATGMPLFDFDQKPTDLETFQALAAVGQFRLLSKYQKSLERHDIVAGQVLLTITDIEKQESRVNAKRALERLMQLGALPIVNENDTVATTEIRFGDNDRLAAMVAMLLDADALVFLSDVDGLYDMPPTKPEAKLIQHVAFGMDLAGLEIAGTNTGVGTGGAITKVAAAKSCTEVGISVFITNADNVIETLAGESVGTFFEPNPQIKIVRK